METGKEKAKQGRCECVFTELRGLGSEPVRQPNNKTQRENEGDYVRL